MLRKYPIAFLVSSLFATTVLVIITVGVEVSADRFSGLCPPSYPRQVAFNNTGRCYTVGSSGPCPKMMVVASNPFNPNYGQCRCKSLGSSCFGRPLLEWDDRCYFEFSQGACRKGHWLIRGKQGFATCQKNPCPLIENERELLRADIPRKNFYFTQQSHSSFQCYKTGTRAFCGEDQKAYFLGSESFPRCLSYEPWDCDHYSGGGSPSLFGSSNEQSLTLRQGDPNRRPSPGFGVPYDGI